MNKVILMGRLTRNPEIRYSQGENPVAVARFTLAVDRRFKRDNEATADFINCVAFGKTAEFFERYMRQGTKVCLDGRIQTGSYNRQDGSKVFTTEVIVENAEFAESKAAASGQPQGGYPAQAPAGYGGGQYQQSQQPYPSYQQGSQQPAYGNPNAYQGAPAQAPSSMEQPAFMEQPSYTAGPAASPAQEAVDEGFMQIPDELNDEGLPFH